MSDLAFVTSPSGFHPVASSYGSFLGPFPLSTSKCCNAQCSEGDQYVYLRSSFSLVKKKRGECCARRSGGRGERSGKLVQKISAMKRQEVIGSLVESSLRSDGKKSYISVL